VSEIVTPIVVTPIDSADDLAAYFAAVEASRAKEEAAARAEWEAGPDPYEPGPYTGDEPDWDGWCGDA
jgi:hypothetical protein